MEGDIKVVNIIEDWDVLSEYAGEKLGFYQLLSNDGIIEIRVQTGRIGFKKEFEKGDDPLLIKSWISAKNTASSKSAKTCVTTNSSSKEQRKLEETPESQPMRSLWKPSCRAHRLRLLSKWKNTIVCSILQGALRQSFRICQSESLKTSCS